MELQKELKSAKFESVFQQALVNIFFTYHWSNQHVKDILSPYDITQQQYNVLRILRGQYPQPCTNNLLKSRIIDKMSDVSRIIERLVQKKYVIKTVNEGDKRALDILISDKGLDLLNKLDKEIDFSAFIRPNLTEEEASQLNVLLDKFRG
ncbi:MAG: MarR family transcriptional regulator [Chitinophagaceae bacterium]|nr:MAG: MarR family transcriptional regulator [Chitinophagaceae bacterium]